MRQGLIARTLEAEHIQLRINSWCVAWRLRIPEHEKLTAKILHKANLETQCTDCGAVMDTAINPVSCIKCGSPNTCSPYYC